MQQYGTQVDPLPQIHHLLETSADISNEEMHSSLSKTFLGLRDLHTAYYLPAPHSCYRLVWPLEFTLVESVDLDNDPMIIVKSFANAPMYEKFKGKVKIGDRLLQFNGLNFTQLREKYFPYSGGANNFGGQRSLLTFLSFQSGKINIFPDETGVKYLLMKPNGQKYTVSSQVASRVFKPCIASNGQLASGDFKPVASMTPQEAKIEAKRQLLNMEYTAQNEMRLVFDQSPLVSMTETLDKALTWTIKEAHGFKLGIIKISSFKPRLAADSFVLVIRDLLVGPLQNTDAIMFDVRSNGGGLISLAESIPQLFAAKVTPTNARVLKHPTNQHILLGSTFAGSPWASAYSNSSKVDIYSDPVPFVTQESINGLGMAYLKPVSVLMDAQCYSACDLFTAQMKDSADAVIFGEDPNTGGCGANVVEHRKYFTTTLPQVFTPLPNFQDMRLAWRQSVRVGKSKGKLIEDFGVSADYVVRPTAQNILQDDEYGQLRFIIERLKEFGNLTEKNNLYFDAEPQTEAEISLGDGVSFSGKAAWITRIELVANSSVLNFLKLPKSSHRNQFTLEPKEKMQELGYEKFTINGYDGFQQVLQTFRLIRLIPRPQDYFLVENFNWNFKPLKFIGVYNKFSSRQNGWQINSNSISIGNGVSYADNLKTAASFFISIPSSIQRFYLRIKGNYDTEDGFDFFHIQAVVPDLLEEYILSTSGQGNIDEKFDLSEFSGTEKLELKFLFVSDGAVSGQGVSITHLSFNVV